MGQSRIVRVGIDWLVLERFASGAVSLPFPRFFVGPAIASLAHPWRRTGAKDSEKVGMTGPRSRPDPPTHPARPPDQNDIRAGERQGTLSRLFHHVAASFQLAAPDKLKTCPHKVSAASSELVGECGNARRSVPRQGWRGSRFTSSWFWCPVSWYPIFPELGNFRTARCKNPDGVEPTPFSTGAPARKGTFFSNGKEHLCRQFGLGGDCRRLARSVWSTRPGGPGAGHHRPRNRPLARLRVRRDGRRRRSPKGHRGLERLQSQQSAFDGQ